MSFIVTALKWRPLLFKDVVGQGHITRTLQNSVATNRIHHAYLFSGPRGVGKTTTARIFARSINCFNPNGSEPCNVCESCNAILESKSLDVIEIDGASNNSVDDIRKLRENAKYPPSLGKKKMYIIDEVHMLSTAAFNALLKILEEPPPHLMFVFATTEQHKVPATILSRCQRHEFKRIDTSVIIDQLKEIAGKEFIKMDDDSYMTIANKADGSMRDAQSIFDQVVAFAGVDVKYSQMIDALHLIDSDFFFSISSSAKSGQLDEMFRLSKEIISKGYDLQEVLSGLLEHYRNLLTINVTGNSDLISTSDSFIKKYEDYAKDFEKTDLLRILNLIAQAEQTIKYASQPKIKFELTLIQLASMDKTSDISELINELKNSSIDNTKQNTHQTIIARDNQKNYNAPKTQASNVQTKEVPKIVQESNDEQQVIDKEVSRVGKEISLSEDWNQFLEKYSAKEGLSFLRSTFNVFTENEIIVYTDTEFIYDNIQNKKQKLSDRLEEFYKRKINLKIVLDPTRTFGEKATLNHDVNKQKEINSSKNDTDEENGEIHPIDKKIMETFSARKIKR